MQVYQIINHLTVAEELRPGCFCTDDGWDITDHKDYLKGSVWMNNFRMFEFFELIKVDPDNVQWTE